VTGVVIACVSVQLIPLEVFVLGAGYRISG